MQHARRSAAAMSRMDAVGLLASAAILTAACICVAGVHAADSCLAESDFSWDLDGWEVEGEGARDLAHMSKMITAGDDGASTWYFVAPHKFTGSKRDAYGGHLSFRHGFFEFNRSPVSQAPPANSHLFSLDVSTPSHCKIKTDCLKGAATAKTSWVPPSTFLLLRNPTGCRWVGGQSSLHTPSAANTSLSSMKQLDGFMPRPISLLGALRVLLALLLFAPCAVCLTAFFFLMPLSRPEMLRLLSKISSIKIRGEHCPL
jgi:hypothetical protein